MNPRFNPLLEPSKESSAQSKPFQLKVVPSEKVATPFKSLSSALAGVKPGRMGTGDTNQGDHEHEPKIELQRDGERVTRITVNCGCGHVMEIDCEYGKTNLE